MTIASTTNPASSNGFIDDALLSAAAQALHAWARAVPSQNGRHVWSLLPVKFAGARPGINVAYREEDDKAFLDRFFAYRSGPRPYFDPFTATWLPEGYYHSNAATFRKKTFRNSWLACTWDDETLTLAPTYPAIFREKVLKKAGKVTPLPALAAALWFYKRPQAELPTDHPFHQGLPASATAVLHQFRQDFHLDATEWSTIFSPDAQLAELYAEAALLDAQLSQDQVKAVCDQLAVATGSTTTAPPLTTGGTSPQEIITAAEAEADAKGLRLPPGLLARVVAALSHSNVRLMGAPGTGKSTVAQLVLQACAGDQWDFALATTQWSNEDVIGGPVPDPAQPTQLVFQPGLVTAAADAGRWVGIDEINRADIDAAFGELFGLLAGFDITLPYQHEPGSDKRVKIYARRPEGDLEPGEYGLPSDWRMIATMNSWDKASLSRVSFAFSRRWCTVYLPVPDPPAYDAIINDALTARPAANSAGVDAALKRLFVSDATAPHKTLRALGLALGPAIALACVRDIAACAEVGVSHADAFVSAVEGFMLPQFEGQMDLHDDIAAALLAACDDVAAGEAAKAALADRLAVFTGKRSALVF